MGLAYNEYLSGAIIYGCKNCKAHLGNHEDIISRVCLSFSPLLSIYLPPTSRVTPLSAKPQAIKYRELCFQTSPKPSN